MIPKRSGPGPWTLASCRVTGSLNVTCFAVGFKLNERLYLGVCPGFIPWQTCIKFLTKGKIRHLQFSQTKKLNKNRHVKETDS